MSQWLGWDFILGGLMIGLFTADLFVHRHSWLAKLRGKNSASTPPDVILAQLAEPRPLPMGRAEFEAWSDRIISGACIPGATARDQKFALAGMVMHTKPTESFVSDGYFVQSLRIKRRPESGLPRHDHGIQARATKGGRRGGRNRAAESRSGIVAGGSAQLKFWQTKRFLAMQRAWYQKLAQLGFTDAEELVGTEMVLSQNAHHAAAYEHQDRRAARQEYYRILRNVNFRRRVR